MDYISRRPMFAVAAFTTAGALALTASIVAPPDLHAPSIAAARISSQTVQLADAWSDLATDTVASLSVLAKVFVGAESGAPLPSPTIFLAPIVTQLMLNQLIYLGQLFNGQGALIPGEISTHLTNLATLAGELGIALPQFIVGTLETPLVALSQAITSISTATNPLIGLLEAPAVFLNIALNSQFGFLGPAGPIGFPIAVRNAVAKAIDPPLPTWLSDILQPGRAPSAAALTPKAAVTLKVSAASSARSKSPASSSRTTSAKASSHGAGGVGHGKRG